MPAISRPTSRATTCSATAWSPHHGRSAPTAPCCRGGGLRPIAFGAPRASPLFPGLPLINLPLIKESVPGFETRNWFGVAGPGGMPPEILAKWNEALRRVAAQKSFRDRMAESGMGIIVGSPEEFRASIAADRALAEVIQKAGTRAE